MDTASTVPRVTASARVQPAHPTPKPTTTYLSIVDSTVATLGAATAIWVFGRHANGPSGLETVRLTESLAHTLSSYPHFAGHLDLTAWPVEGAGCVPHTRRFRRAFVTHGYPTDPGVELQTAELAANAADLFPNGENAASASHKTWDLTEAKLNERFSPTGEFPANRLASGPPTPAVLIRITFLACQSIVIVPRFAHPLADAEAMIAFMKAWGQVHAARSRQLPPPTLAPVFDPSMLDAKAKGDIDSEHPDAELIQQSMALPLPRFDWWEHVRGQPANFDENPQVKLPAEIPSHVLDKRLRGRQIPWGEWDRTARVTYNIFRLSGDEVEWLYQQIVDRLRGDGGKVSISRHDALLAFIWQMVAVAKPPGAGASGEDSNADDLVCLDTTLGLRPRLGLPALFVGSPILPAGLSAPRVQVAGRCSGLFAQAGTAAGDQQFPESQALADAASLIRRHIAKFDGDALAAWLHEQAFEVAPQRWWNGFLGSKHTMATSWIRSGLREVDFGAAQASASTGASVPGAADGNSVEERAMDGRLLWAGVIGPNLDGLVTLSEAEQGHGRSWWQGGVDVDMKLEATAMTRVVELMAKWRGERGT